MKNITAKVRTKFICPKCGSLLFKDPINGNKWEHFCLMCGLRGKTYEEMEAKLAGIQKIFDETMRTKFKGY